MDQSIERVEKFLVTAKKLNEIKGNITNKIKYLSEIRDNIETDFKELLKNIGSDSDFVAPTYCDDIDLLTSEEVKLMKKELEDSKQLIETMKKESEDSKLLIESMKKEYDEEIVKNQNFINRKITSKNEEIMELKKQIDESNTSTIDRKNDLIKVITECKRLMKGYKTLEKENVILKEEIATLHEKMKKLPELTKYSVYLEQVERINTLSKRLQEIENKTDIDKWHDNILIK